MQNRFLNSKGEVFKIFFEVHFEALDHTFKPCPRCRGTGEIRHNDYYSYDERITCTTCFGSRREKTECPKLPDGLKQHMETAFGEWLTKYEISS